MNLSRFVLFYYQIDLNQILFLFSLKNFGLKTLPLLSPSGDLEVKVVRDIPTRPGRPTFRFECSKLL